MQQDLTEQIKALLARRSDLQGKVTSAEKECARLKVQLGTLDKEINKLYQERAGQQRMFDD